MEIEHPWGYMMGIRLRLSDEKRMKSVRKGKSEQSDAVENDRNFEKGRRRCGVYRLVTSPVTTACLAPRTCALTSTVIVLAAN